MLTWLNAQQPSNGPCSLTTRWIYSRDDSAPMYVHFLVSSFCKTGKLNLQGSQAPAVHSSQATWRESRLDSVPPLPVRRLEEGRDFGGRRAGRLVRRVDIDLRQQSSKVAYCFSTGKAVITAASCRYSLVQRGGLCVLRASSASSARQKARLAPHSRCS